MNVMFEGSETMASKAVGIGQTFEEVVSAALMPRKSISGSRKKMQDQYVSALDGRRQMAQTIRSICGELLSHNVVEPESPPMPAAIRGENSYDWIMEDNARWVGEMAEQLVSDRVGRVTVLGDDAVRYSFFEVSENRGLWKIEKERVAKSHDIVNVKCRHLKKTVPDGLPGDVADVYGRLIRSPLARFARVIEGHLVTEQAAIQDQWREDTELAKRTKEFGRGIRDFATSRAGKAIAAGTAVAAGIGALASAVAANVGPVATVAAVSAADPALVIGDIVLIGWKD